MMNLGELKVRFNDPTNDEFVFTNGFNAPHSYRGIYADVAFEPARNVTLGEIKRVIARADAETFMGWKGGEYAYGDDARCHLAYEGTCDPTGTGDAEDFEELVADMMLEYIMANHPTPIKQIEVTRTVESKMAFSMGPKAKTITIPQAEYDEMIERIEWLECLEQAGVDNWDGYDEARELYRERNS